MEYIKVPKLNVSCEFFSQGIVIDIQKRSRTDPDVEYRNGCDFTEDGTTDAPRDSLQQNTERL